MKPIEFNHFNKQIGKLGKPFRLSGVMRGTNEKWVNGVLKHDWYYTFKYDDGNFFALHLDFNDKIIEKLNHNETLK